MPVALPSSRDFAGGTVSALTGLPVILSCALIVAAPLPAQFFGLSLQSAVVSAIIANLVGSWLTGIPAHISGPRISLSLLMAAWLAATPGLDPGTFLALVGAATVLSGAMQVMMGMMRLGSLVRFLPFPVLAGFITAVNIAIVVSQVPIALSGYLGQYPGRSDIPQPMSLIALAATIAATLAAPRLLKRVPATIVGVVAGACIFFIAGWGMAGGFDYHNASLAQLSITANALSLFGMNDLPLTRALVPHALALAILGALESLMSAAAVQKLTGEPLHANVELVGLGFTNMLIGLAGGMPSAGTPLRSESAIRSGARSRAAGAIAGVFTIILIFGLARWLALLPTSVISGSLLATTWLSLQTWGIKPVTGMLREVGRHPTLWGELAIFALVLSVGLVYGPTAGVGFGAVCAMALFISKSGQSLVRRVLDGRQLRSSLQRNAEARAVLDRDGASIVYVELGGALFFGSADALLRETRDRIPAGGTLVVDCERLTDVDSSGAKALAEVAQACLDRSCRLWIAGRQAIDSHRATVAAAGLFEVVPEDTLVDTGDHALERAENALLERQGGSINHASLPLADARIFKDLSPADLDRIAGMLEERKLRAGEVLFSEGDAVDGLYVIDAGQISINIRDFSGIPRRIAAFTPGTIIGEIAFVEGGTRSALARAEEDSRLWLLRPRSLVDLELENPRLVHLLMANIAREIAGRLRTTTLALRQR